jgi:hypothetical protein
MNLRIVFILVFVFLSNSAFSGGTKPTVNEYVHVGISLKQKTLKPRQTGEMLIALKPKAGIHINLQPPITIEFDSSASTTLSVDTLVVPANGKYFDTTKQLRQSFRLLKSVKPGKLSIAGTLVYFYCSDADGWCSRFKQPFKVTVSVSK